VKPFVVDVRVYDDAGAGDVDQLAYAVATGIAYVRALAEAGVPAERAFGLLEFRVTVSADQFTSIARLRALRRLWARVGEVLEVPDGTRRRPARRDERPHGHRADPWVNLCAARSPPSRRPSAVPSR
jgi:methylmalonyl-CoA mutase